MWMYDSWSSHRSHPSYKPDADLLIRVVHEVENPIRRPHSATVCEGDYQASRLEFVVPSLGIESHRKASHWEQKHDGFLPQVFPGSTREGQPGIEESVHEVGGASGSANH